MISPESLLSQPANDMVHLGDQGEIFSVNSTATEVHPMAQVALWGNSISREVEEDVRPK